MKIFFATILAAVLLMTNIASAEVEVNRAELIQRALDVQKNSYAPYSNFNVAAAVLCASGKIYTGVNVEANGVVTDYCPPCGVCRQGMREFANPKNLLIIMAKSPTDYVEKTLEELLPMSFGPENLK